MSAQSKAMYWQARCRELEAMVERMAERLARATCLRIHYPHGQLGECDSCKDDAALKAYAAMKGGK